MSMRFPMDADTREDAEHYLRNRAVQLLADGFRATGIEALETWGLRARLERGGQVYQAIYVYKSYRGRKILSGYVRGDSTPFVTVPDCNVEAWFKKHDVNYVLAGQHTTTHEYKAIAAHYGDRRAKRSGVYLMNHIDEGIAILRWLKAGNRTERAFCLHPLLQKDEDLLTQYARLVELTEDLHVLAYAMEYRSIANAHLSDKSPSEPIKLSPLAGVNIMLAADKIQNYKDFLRYHKKTHPRSDALDAYFQRWLERLDIPMQLFYSTAERLAPEEKLS